MSKIINLFSYGKNRKSFRNNKGHALAHSGGGHCKCYIIVNFESSYWHLHAQVLSICYDPNRSALLALVVYTNGVLNYVLAPQGISPGYIYYSGLNSLLNVGVSFYLWQLPLGSKIFNLSPVPGRSGLYIRAAGVYGVILRKTSSYVVVRLPSSEVKAFNLECLAVLGRVSNASFRFKNLAKAGASRWIGRRPVVRGVAKNPVDHPHGGGEGKTSGGRVSVTPWGKITKGQPTRKPRSVGLKKILVFRSGLKNLRSFIH